MTLGPMVLLVEEMLKADMTIFLLIYFGCAFLLARSRQPRPQLAPCAPPHPSHHPNYTPTTRYTHAFASLSMGILTGIGLGAPISGSTLRPAGC